VSTELLKDQGEKSQISWDFQRHLQKRRPISREIHRNFGTNFTEKQSLKNSQFHGNFLGKSIGFALIWILILIVSMCTAQLSIKGRGNHFLHHIDQWMIQDFFG